jgi:mannan endo-1,4-beta-mannosidase
VSGCSFINPVTAVKEATSAAPKQSIGPVAKDSCAKPANGKYLGLSVSSPNLFVPTERAMGITANVVTKYYSIGDAISIQAIASLCAEHILPIIELDSDSMSVAKIANGSEDKYFTSLALQIGALQSPVGIDLNHEFNGPWFGWGFKDVTSGQFVAAWRHIVTLFRDNGASNVIWIWNPNVMSQGTLPNLKPWYPGDAYVNWVGLDGYFYSSNDSYASVFDYTVDHIRSFTKVPMLIVETGANPTSGRARAINSIFQGVEKMPGILGLIYFDYDKTTTHNWYINNDPSALTAFKADAAAYMNATG